MITAFYILTACMLVAIGWGVHELYVTFLQRCPRGGHHEWSIDVPSGLTLCEKCRRIV